VLIPGAESLIAERETEYAPDSVMVAKAHHDGANDVIQPRAQAAAGHNPASQLGGVEVDLFSGTGLLEERRGLVIPEIPLDLLKVIVIKNVVLIIDEMHGGHGRGNPARAQPADGKIWLTSQHKVSPSDLTISMAILLRAQCSINKCAERIYELNSDN
jgi:hypothetical protein